MRWRKVRFDKASDKDFPELFSRRAPMNRAASSPVLRTPSPPLGAEERDGERRFMGREPGRGPTRPRPALPSPSAHRYAHAVRVLIVGCGYVGLPLGGELARRGH